MRIFDTTLRDGEQSPGATLTSKEKLDIARQLSKLGVDIIEAGFPIASPGKRSCSHNRCQHAGIVRPAGTGVGTVCSCRQAHRAAVVGHGQGLASHLEPNCSITDQHSSSAGSIRTVKGRFSTKTLAGIQRNCYDQWKPASGPAAARQPQAAVAAHFLHPMCAQLCPSSNTSFHCFTSRPADDFEAVRAIAMEVGNDVHDDGYVPVICGLSRTRFADLERAWEAVRHAKRPRVHTFIATSEIHMQYKLRMSREQVRQRVLMSGCEGTQQDQNCHVLAAGRTCHLFVTALCIHKTR